MMQRIFFAVYSFFPTCFCWLDERLVKRRDEMLVQDLYEKVQGFTPLRHQLAAILL